MNKPGQDSRIGFIGLGSMGLPMSLSLLNAGYQVLGSSSDQQRVGKFVEAGGLHGDTLREIVDGATVVITMIPDGPILEEIVGQVKQWLNPGCLFIDMSTVGALYAQKAANTLRELGVSFLDAPVSGGVKGAEEGTLSIMVGGEKNEFLRAKPIFETLGGNISYFGSVGSGQTVKSANQILVAANMAALAEAVLFMENKGLDVTKALRTMQGGLADSAIMRVKGRNMVKREFPSQFTLNLHLKDLGIALEAIEESDMIAPVSSLVKQIYAIGSHMGVGERDHSALIDALEQINGTYQGGIENNG